MLFVFFYHPSLICPPEPKDPPNNVSLSVIPEEVTRVSVTFIPPAEPNGNISSYMVQIYQEGKLIMTSHNLYFTKTENNTLTVVIDGLKGGQMYTIRVRTIFICSIHTSMYIKMDPQWSRTRSCSSSDSSSMVGPLPCFGLSYSFLSSLSVLFFPSSSFLHSVRS